MEKPTIVEVFADNGDHSHWTLIETETGVKLWSEDPEECKAMGYPVKQSKLRPSFWFMRYNHTFIKLEGRNLNEIAQHAILCAKENPYGAVCPVIILCEETELRRVGEMVPVSGDGELDLTEWLAEIKKEACIKQLESLNP